MEWWYIAGLVSGVVLMGLADRYVFWAKSIDFAKKHSGQIVVDPVALKTLRDRVLAMESSALWNEYMALTGKKKEGT